MAAPVVTIQKNGQMLRSLTLDAGEAVLGRAEGCVIRLDDRAVSRQHAVLKSTPTGLTIEKKSHLAPLIVNGSECESAALKEGDEVCIGPYVLRITQAQGQASPEMVATGEISQAERERAPAEVGTNVLGFDRPLDGSAASAMDSDGVVEMQENSEPASERSEDVPSLSLAPSQSELSAMISEDARTRVIDHATLVRLKLKFAPGSANFEEREFDQDELSLGRGQGCDVVIQDKKASRKHLMIRRQGSGPETSFTIRDLESANGIFVNGARVTEHVLSGDDVVRVGDTEFIVQAVLPDYERRAREFLKVDHDAPIHESSAVVEGMARVTMDAMPQVSSSQEPVGGSDLGFSPGAGGSDPFGVPGMSVGAPAKMNLLERYRAMPPRSRVIWIIFVGMLVYTLMDQIPQSKPTPKGKGAKKEQVADSKKGADQKGDSAQGNLPTFEQLKPDLQKFVESQYNLALEYFRNRDYDRTLFEVRKIFQYVSDFRDARDLERYAVERKQSVQAQEDERKRREQEQASKAKVASLIIEVEGHMARKEYVHARELFAEIVALDPENPQIAVWRKEIDAVEERLSRERQLQQLAAETRESAKQVLVSGYRTLKEKKWARAIEIFNSVLEMEAPDAGIVAKARSGIKSARAGIASFRDPLLAEGSRLEQEGSFADAFKKFLAAQEVDPESSPAREGMDRTRGILKDRSKRLYTEAVLAESYSDFSVAKAKFEELLKMAPQDDPYFERARRKLSRYGGKESEGVR